MSDGGDEPHDDGRAGGAGRPASDEPLGDLASEVRERAGGDISSDRPEPTDRDGPLADVASKVDERRRRRTEGSDPFESVEVGEIDGEKLWEELASGDADEPSVSVPAEETTEIDWDEDDEGLWGDDEDWDESRDVRTIPKDTCHGCPHFGDPPELACTHDGTDILAMTDTEHFRVADCPMVEDDENIESFTDEEVGDDDETEVGDDDETGVGDDDETGVGDDDETEVGDDDDTEVSDDDETGVSEGEGDTGDEIEASDGLEDTDDGAFEDFADGDDPFDDFGEGDESTENPDSEADEPEDADAADDEDADAADDESSSIVDFADDLAE